MSAESLGKNDLSGRYVPADAKPPAYAPKTRARRAGASEQRRNVWMVASAQLATFILTFGIFLYSPMQSATSDPKYTLLVSESILEHHTSALNGYVIPGVNFDALHTSCPLIEWQRNYQLAKIGSDVLYCYPPGSSILSLPFVAAINAGGLSVANRDGLYSVPAEVAMQRIIASMLMAMLACGLNMTALLLLPLSWSVAIALAAALGTQIWSSASRCLWSHTWEVLLAGGVIYLLLRAEEKRRDLVAPILGTMVAWMYFVRPTGLLVGIGVSVFVLLFYRREFIAYAVIGAVWLAAFITYWPGVSTSRSEKRRFEE